MFALHGAGFVDSSGARCRGITKLLSRLLAPFPRSFGEAGARGGMSRGRLVDRQIAECITTGAAPQHIMAKAFFKLLTRLEITPTHAQVAVGFERIATAVDVLGRDRDGRRVVIEVKTGFANCAPPRPMKPPYEHVLATAENCSLAQLALTRWLYQQTFRGEASGLLVTLDTTSAHVRPLGDTFDGATLYSLISRPPPRPRRRRQPATACR